MPGEQNRPDREIEVDEAIEEVQTRGWVNVGRSWATSSGSTVSFGTTLRPEQPSLRRAQERMRERLEHTEELILRQKKAEVAYANARRRRLLKKVTGTIEGVKYPIVYKKQHASMIPERLKKLAFMYPFELLDSESIPRMIEERSSETVRFAPAPLVLCIDVSRTVRIRPLYMSGDASTGHEAEYDDCFAFPLVLLKLDKKFMKG